MRFRNDQNIDIAVQSAVESEIRHLGVDIGSGRVVNLQFDQIVSVMDIIRDVGSEDAEAAFMFRRFFPVYEDLPGVCRSLNFDKHAGSRLERA